MTKKYNMRTRMMLSLTISVSIILLTILISYLLSPANLITDFTKKSLSPNLQHPFGTDWLGRDMFTRTLKGLRLSLFVGFLGAAVGALIATVLGIAAATLGKKVDSIVSWLVDMFIGMPHLIFIILISFAVGGGIRGVVFGVAFTHWPSLTRIIRGEVYAIKSCEYIQISRNLGKSNWYIARKHILPHILPQIMVGFLLLFPHAIIHEASITFLGFGLSVQTPSIGLILSEAVKHISIGDWWLAIFPGLILVCVVKSFDNIGEHFRVLINPTSANE
ncbi:MAG: ABC transporter permease [Halanaerobiales bacterium]|nr:ABC transporter permease [Halanaerobiales bacterium]